MPPKQWHPRHFDPVEEAVRKRTIWQSWAALPAPTRLKISLGICAVAVAGIFVSDRLEASVPASPNSTPYKTSSKS
ncbi:hypothetical protein FA95DRAFT_1493721 [Auriscalpium vulgare]|uniref:Uncharacterized protein n=1 Tax=Auriscalpium vulgare TaxID=40419 RepID=A0ACB8RRZ0_9AGAM|nr:hypothetical protein FA95DRAFT_1493721 [Auriscalpium vulgare]